MGPDLIGPDLLMGASHAGADPPVLRDAGVGARTPRPRSGADRGLVTAETAVALPTLVLVALMLAWVVTLVTAQLQCVDAARAGARAVSRGESISASEAAALQAAPQGATVMISRNGDFVRVEVTAQIEPAGGLLGFLPAATVEGVAHAIAEDAVAAPRAPTHHDGHVLAGFSSSAGERTRAGLVASAGPVT